MDNHLFYTLLECNHKFKIFSRAIVWKTPHAKSTLSTTKLIKKTNLKRKKVGAKLTPAH